MDQHGRQLRQTVRLGPLAPGRGELLAVALRRAILTRALLPQVVTVLFHGADTVFDRPAQVAESRLEIARRLGRLALQPTAATGDYGFAAGGPQALRAGDIALLTGLPVALPDEVVARLGPGGALDLVLTVGRPSEPAGRLARGLYRVPPLPSPLQGWEARELGDDLRLTVTTDGRLTPAHLLRLAAKELLAGRSAPPDWAAVLRQLARGLPEQAEPTDQQTDEPAARQPSRGVALLDPHPAPGRWPGPENGLVRAAVGGLVESIGGSSITIAGREHPVDWTAALRVSVGEQVAAGEPVAELGGQREGRLAPGRWVRISVQPGDGPSVASLGLRRSFERVWQRTVGLQLSDRTTTRTTTYDPAHLNSRGIVQPGIVATAGMVLIGLLGRHGDESVRCPPELDGWQVAAVEDDRERVVLRMVGLLSPGIGDRLGGAGGWQVTIGDLREPASMPPAPDGAPADLLVRGAPPAGCQAGGWAYLSWLE